MYVTRRSQTQSKDILKEPFWRLCWQKNRFDFRGNLHALVTRVLLLTRIRKLVHGQCSSITDL